MKNNNKRKGFTLVELLVVIAILAILATVSVVGYTSFIEKANKSNAETEAAQVKEYILAELLIDGYYYLGSAQTTSGESTITTYYGIGKISEKYVVATGTYDSASGEFTVSAKAGTDAAIDIYFDTIADKAFADLDGTFSVNNDGNLVYTLNGQKAVIDFN